LQNKRGNVKSLAKTKVEVNTGEVRNIIERVSVNQGKLCLGFRTNTPPGSKDYYKLLVYNSILGGGLHSKLFQNVRERQDLRIMRFQGLKIQRTDGGKLRD